MYMCFYFLQVTKAYESRVNLSAQGFFKAPDIWMDWDKGIGKPYSYYCYRAGCSVVEVDTLTGSFQVFLLLIINYRLLVGLYL